MRQIIKLSLVISVLLISITGCSSKKVKMKALVPAKVPVLTAKRNVAVSVFTNDKVGLSSKIEASLAGIVLDKKNFFTVANRASLNKILDEQKLQSSDLSDGSNAAKIGKLIGAEAIIGGSVVSSHEDGSYIEQREKCIAYYKGKCTRTRPYNVTCPTAAASVSASINVIDVETARVIHAKTITKNYTADGCRVSGGRITPGAQALNGLADNVAFSFTKALAPRYVVYSVQLMEKVKSVDLTSAQEKVFVNALKYLENRRAKKAEKLLTDLYNETGSKAFEIAYNLGLIKQSLAKYEIALELFMEADKNVTEPNKLIDSALNDIKDTIKKQKEANEQMKQS